VASKQKLSRHKFGGRNNGPSRQRYWAQNTLEKHKVNAIIKDTGLSRAEATALWKKSRQGRMK
jgi:hypothetical protein